MLTQMSRLPQRSTAASASACDVGFVPRVALEDERLATMRLDESGRLGGARRVGAVVAGHVGALAGERHGDGLADAARDAR